MLTTVHRIGSRIRRSRFLGDRTGLWERIEPTWQGAFERLSRRRGFGTRINQDEFRLLYTFGSRYDRHDKQEYEPAFYHCFTRRINEGMHVFDIGAHIGIFALAAARRVGTQGRVYAFEPAPGTADILERHVWLNGWQDRVEVVRAAVGDVNGTIPFYVHGTSMAASVSRNNVEVLNPERPETPARAVDARAVTLDQFCSERNIVPDVVKIDVEGAELKVLEGARELLLGEEFPILCEIHPRNMRNCGASVEELMAYLDELGYALMPLDETAATDIFHCLIMPAEHYRHTRSVSTVPD